MSKISIWKNGRLPSSQVFLISSEKHFQACLDKFRPIYLNQMKNLYASITVFAKTLELESKLRMTLGISNSKKVCMICKI